MSSDCNWTWTTYSASVYVLSLLERQVFKIALFREKITVGQVESEKIHDYSAVFKWNAHILGR